MDDRKLVDDDMESGDVLDDERVLYRATFSENYMTYRMWALFIVLLATISGIVLLPFLPLFYIGIKANFKSRRLILTEKTLVWKQGFYGCCCVFWNESSKHVPLEKVTDVTFAQGCLERKYNIATITIQTAGQNGPDGRPELRIQGINDAKAFRKIVMNAKAECMARTFGGVSSAVSAVAVDKSGSKYGSIAAGAAPPAGADLRDILLRIEGSVKAIQDSVAARDAARGAIPSVGPV